MYKATKISFIALSYVLLCAGCDTASQCPLRADLERSVHKPPDTRVWYPQRVEPINPDPHGYRELVKATGPLEYLKESRVFRLGAVGFAAETPPEDIALHMLMAEDDAAASLKKLFDEGSIAGKLYALTGLYYSERSTFKRLVSGLRKDSRSVSRQSGCTAFTQTVKEVVKSIESGDFDNEMQWVAK